MGHGGIIHPIHREQAAMNGAQSANRQQARAGRPAGQPARTPALQNPAERTGTRMMSQTTVLITDMSILVGIFLLGLIAKIFPRNGRKHDSHH